ncbi:MAG: hypothetical protein H6782_04740 [Candidatus Nomurabacteria bacterium]|nr:MAG: hypothetical protein H6782_04740 [Candidatus Nomurabacteria bacterium]
MNRIRVRRLFVCMLVTFVLLPNVTLGASLYIDPASSTLYRGDSIKVAVRLDTDEANNECVNAIDGVLTYTDNIAPVDVSLGSSIFSVWVETPTINKEDRTVTFAGGVPNGYCGRIVGDPMLTNVVAEIVFRSPGFSVGGGSSEEALAKLSFSDETTAYLNDGLGTKADLSTYGATVELKPQAGQSQVNDWKNQITADKIAPEEFSISVQKDNKAFSGDHFIVFNTTDKQTGIDHYEVMEEPLAQLGSFQWGRADAPWVIERSPYVLKDQSLNSIIRVKAVDKAGNEYIATLIPDESMRTISRAQVLTIAISFATLIVVVLTALVVFYWLKRNRGRKNSVERADILENTNGSDYDEPN